LTVAASQRGVRLLPWGGARNRKDRKSLCLTERQAQRLIDGAMSAWGDGKPLNRFISGAWEVGGISPCDSVAATSRFITLAREWLRERGYDMPWIWVQECGSRSGAHCHILMHVPPALDPLFRSKPRQWAGKVLGGSYVPKVINTRRLLYASSSALMRSAYYAELMGRLHYMLKCTPAALEGPLGMNGASVAAWGQSGLVYGKRAAVWQGTREYAEWARDMLPVPEQIC